MILTNKKEIPLDGDKVVTLREAMLDSILDLEPNAFEILVAAHEVVEAIRRGVLKQNHMPDTEQELAEMIKKGAKT